ncbi:hypothetical protein LTR72_008174 [Exophiala xenobiotica]|nr:hypothetical protein LTR72_008174 [Exophiala xenobiotica]KAK5291325.1 hypothetical protein LTR14_005899 [Exophiala xenobiotica]KAK5482005.1 hypothetical protein LTR55_006886 [Exophiala xenobiotica]
MAYKGQAKVKLGSQVDIEIAGDIMTQMDQHPNVQALKADPDFEEVWPLATNAEQTEKMKDGKDIHHLVFTSLRGSRGVFPRAFYNRSRCILVMVVACSYGCEGEYGLLHRGAMETMIQESVRLLAQFWFPPDMTYKLSELYVGFGRINRPNTIWCITCVPLATVFVSGLFLPKDWCYARRVIYGLFLAATYQFSDKMQELVDAVDENKKNESNLWPDWLNPRDWNQMTSSIVAQVSPLDGHPLVHTQNLNTNAVGHFHLEDSEDWPPAPPRDMESFYGWTPREQALEANLPNGSEEG